MLIFEVIFGSDGDGIGKFFTLERFYILLIDVFHKPLKLGVHQRFPHEVLMAVFGHKLQRYVFISLSHF